MCNVCQETLTKKNFTKKPFFGRFRSTNLYENPFMEHPSRYFSGNINEQKFGIACGSGPIGFDPFRQP
jgi:hypothetical protein